MKALTIRQPWASLIGLGVKTIETRSWTTRYRGPLAIHAGKRPPEPDLRLGPGGPVVAEEWLVDGDGPEAPRLLDLCNELAHPLPLGAIVATATLADVVPMVAEGDLVEHSARRKDQGPVIAVSRTGKHVTGLTWVNTISPGRYVDKDWTERKIEPNRPYGDFAPGRYAWLLDDIQLCDPIPAKGKQGLWTWQP